MDAKLKDCLDIAWPAALFAAGIAFIIADLGGGIAGIARLFE